MQRHVCSGCSFWWLLLPITLNHGFLLNQNSQKWQSGLHHHLLSPKLFSSNVPLAATSIGENDEKSSNSELEPSLRSPSYRSVRRLERYTRLPVWPVWSGVLIWLVQKMLGNDVAARLEDLWTGRVCPNFFDYDETSPFVMLVHHCHSFAAWDPIRWIQRTFFPEGFPAHPHRGVFVRMVGNEENGFYCLLTYRFSFPYI